MHDCDPIQILSAGATGRRWGSVAAGVAALSAMALLSGCVSSPHADLSGFGKTAADLGKQTDLTFSQANSIGRSASVDRFVQSHAVGLTERQFPPVVPADVANAWSSALSGVERYGLLLGSLTERSRGADTTAALGGLASQLQSSGAGLPPGVAAGFAALGGALVDARAQGKARKIMQLADPHVRELLEAMAGAVGKTDDDGLRGTVYTNWIAALTNLQAAYAVAAEQRDEKSQRAIIARYLDGIDQRDAQFRSLEGFRSSLLALANAHSAAAAGSKQPFAELLSVVEERLDDTRSIYGVLKEGQTR